MKIKVTQEHINKAVRKTLEMDASSEETICQTCALAVALAEQTEEEISVGHLLAFVGKRGYRLDTDAETFVRLFDDNYRRNPKKIKPTEVELTLIK